MPDKRVQKITENQIRSSALTFLSLNIPKSCWLGSDFKDNYATSLAKNLEGPGLFYIELPFPSGIGGSPSVAGSWPAGGKKQ